MSELQIFFWGAVFGGCVVLFFTVMSLRWGMRNKSVLIKLVREIYHIDLLPFICRIEGLLMLIILESNSNGRNTSMMVTYAEIALKEVKQLKLQIVAALKRYENYQ